MTDPTTTLPPLQTAYDVVARFDWPRAWFVGLVVVFVAVSVMLARRGINVNIRDERKFDKDDA
jgi:hypothetical protein